MSTSIQKWTIVPFWLPLPIRPCYPPPAWDRLRRGRKGCESGMKIRLAESGYPSQPPRIYAGDELMRRDDELLRKLMLDFEAQDDPLLVHAQTLGADEEDQKIYYHLRLLADAGFLQETGRTGGVFRMTNAGHDF